MKVNPVIIVSFVVASLLILVIACQNSTEQGNILDDKIVTKESSQKIAESYIKDSNPYTEFNGYGLKLINSEEDGCPLCWKFEYHFNVSSEEIPKSVVAYDCIIETENGKVIESEFEEIIELGTSDINESIPSEYIDCDAIGGRKVYTVGTNNECKAYEQSAGQSSNESICCIHLKTIDNTEDTLENKFFTSTTELKTKYIEKIFTPLNETPQYYQSEYKLYENNQAIISNVDIHKQVDPDNPIIIRVASIEPGKTYNLITIIRSPRKIVLFNQNETINV